MDADAIIAVLGLTPHPEGGWYAETFRDGGGRGDSSAIYFLLREGERSHWHRVADAAEVWHHYAGAPIELSLWIEGEAVRMQRLGSDVLAGERPQIVVPAGCWQAAESLGAWTLLGCTVAPGFDFGAFELAPPGWQPPHLEASN